MKFVTIIIALILASAVVLAVAGPGEQGGAGGAPEQAQGEQPVKVDTQNKGEDQQLKVTTTAGEMKGAPENVAAVRQQMMEQQQTMTKEMEGMGKDEQKVYQNQNQVREAVQAMKMLGEMPGGIGSEVSGIAQGFDNSVQATIQAELKMEKRSGLTKLFAGGDHDAAKAMESQVEQNQVRIQEMQMLHDECDCDAEVKAMLQEQIQTMTQEQARLQDRAEQELSKKGMFGWIWK
ncbi:hypothetical protein GOV07_00715 [Candidatus Woesearchaeota archaeon]|nr:hypothetical protein [Candidatus Woesearchaeota archaeon]